MLRKSNGTLVLFVAAVLFGSSWLLAQQEEELTPDQAKELAIEAYIYGYPLVTMDLTKQVMTNVAEPDKMKAPVGQFINARSYPTAAFKDVTAPNADTLYSTAWLNLKEEPWVLHVPDEAERYYLMPMLSGWTEVFADPGTRTTGTGAADWAITGPDWKGTLPAGLKEYKSPTNMVWVIGRTYCSGTAEDFAAVHKIQDEYSLKPLSFFGKSYTPPKGVVDPKIDMATPVRKQVNQLDAATFFNRLALLLKDNPPAKEDAPLIAKFAQIGIVPGLPFDQTKLNPTILATVEKAAQDKIRGYLDKGLIETNGWTYTKVTGRYGNNYVDRALVAAIGLGANRPQDAIYPISSHDSESKPLNGSNKYVIHFEKGKLPPVKGFWSLTMYTDQYYFVDNALNRYALSQRDPLKTNPDGSVDLYIQHDSPGKEKEANWLPAPTGDFILMFRLYWPDEAILNGSWKPPAIVKK